MQGEVTKKTSIPVGMEEKQLKDETMIEMSNR